MLFRKMQFLSNNLSGIAIISPLKKLELIPACFSCSKSFNLLQSSLGSDDKTNVFETPEAESIELGFLSNLVRDLSLMLLLLTPLMSKSISFAKNYISFLSDKLARSTL